MNCLRCAGACHCDRTAPIDEGDLDFLIQMRRLGGTLIEFENESIHYLRGQGLSDKVLPHPLEHGSL